MENLNIVAKQFDFWITRNEWDGQYILWSVSVHHVRAELARADNLKKMAHILAEAIRYDLCDDSGHL